MSIDRVLGSYADWRPDPNHSLVHRQLNKGPFCESRALVRERSDRGAALTLSSVIPHPSLILRLIPRVFSFFDQSKHAPELGPLGCSSVLPLISRWRRTPAIRRASQDLGRIESTFTGHGDFWSSVLLVPRPPPSR